MQLPGELLSLVFKSVMHLDPCTLLMHVVGVCRQWREVCQHMVTLDLKAGWCDNNSLYRRYLNQTVRFRGVGAFRPHDIRGLSTILAHPGAGTHLKYLNLKGVVVCPELLEDVVRICVNLTTLDIGRVTAVDKCITVIGGGFPRLASLGLRCTQITDAGMAALGNPALACLDLTGCDGVTDKGLGALVAGCSPLLARLVVRGCYEVTDKALAAGGAFPQLSWLDLSLCRRVTDAGVAALASGRAPLLAHLELAGCREITDGGVAALATGGVPLLAHLDLSGCDGVTDAGVTALASGGAPLLARLILTWCTITDAGVAALAGGGGRPRRRGPPAPSNT
jgi:hypothetical protein